MDFLYWFGLIVSLGATGAAGVIAFQGLRSSLRELRAAKREANVETLDDKLDRLRRSAIDLRDLAGEVTAEAEAQSLIAETAAAKAVANQQLASLSEDQAQAVAALIDEGQERRQRSNTRTTIIWAIVGILASNAASVLLTLFFSN